MNTDSPYYFIGLTQWHHPDWYPLLSQDEILDTYSRHFSTVEGNSSFYGLPSESSIQQWNEKAHHSFRFCFKFPQSITHKKNLRHCEQEVAEFLKRVEPLGDRLGVLWMQMGNAFDSSDIHVFERFVSRLPAEFTYGIEVRNLDFFRKDETEKRFNQILMQSEINRASFDTRALFKYPKDDPATRESLAVKPRMPVHAIATGQHPMVRFIAPLELELSYEFLAPWVQKVNQWISEGRQPYIFFHTPDNRQAPELAVYFNEQLKQLQPNLSALSLWQKTSPQEALF